MAFSGGADSLALLLVFWAEAPGRWGRDFVVLHFNHRLRGRVADADEKFCVQVCKALDVKFVAGRWRAARKGASEAAARTARFDFFRREMDRRKIRLLWLGHQQDDIAESMLMRLARGSGTGGAGGAASGAADAGRPVAPAAVADPEKGGDCDRAAEGRRAVARGREQRPGGFFPQSRPAARPAGVAEGGGARRARGRSAVPELLEEDDAALEAWLAEVRPLTSQRRANFG